MRRVLMAWAVVAVTAVVGVVAQPPEASAAIGIPDWLETIAEGAYNACVDVPQSIVGSASGSAGLVAAGGIVGTKAVVPIEGISGITASSAATNAMLADWLAVESAGVTAAGSMTSAQLAAAGEAWAAAHAGTGAYAAFTEAELIASWNAATAAGAAGQVAAPTAFVGSSSAAAVGVDGAATAAVGSGAGAATGGGVTLSASTVGLSAATAAGAFCGTINASYYVFGDSYPAPVEAGAAVTTTGLGPCSDSGSIPGYVAGDLCTTVSLESPASEDVYVWLTSLERAADGTPVPPFQYGSGPLNMQPWGSGQRMSDGSGSAPTSSYGVSLSLLPKIPLGSSSLEVAVPCPMPSWSNMIDATWRDGFCGIGGLAPPSASVDGKAHAAVVLFRSNRYGYGLNWLDVGLSSGGATQDLRASVTCRNPSTMGDTTVTSNSAPFFRADEAAHFDADDCPTGTAPVRVIVDRRNQVSSPFTSWWWSSFDSGSPVQWRSQRVIDWQIPSDVGSNGTTLACLAVGATSCDLVPDGSNVRVGGSGGVARPASEPRTSDLVQDVWTNLEWPTPAPADFGEWAPDSDPDPDPGATTTTVPGSGPGGQTQQEACEAGQGAGCPNPTPSSEPDGPDGSGGECWPSGWGWFNPAEWVLRPIKCALVWAFWDQESADEISALGDEHGWTELVTESSVTTSTAAGPCIDMDYADICTEPILSVELPSVATVLLTAAVLFFGLFEVVGLFARITGGS